MKAGLRFGIAVFAAGLWLGSPAHAQDAAQSNTPASDAIGPRELQNFSLDGKRTRPAQTLQPITVAPAARQPSVARQTAAGPDKPLRAPAASAQKRIVKSSVEMQPARPAERQSASASKPSAATAAASLSPGLAATAPLSQSVPQPGFAPDPAAPANLAPEGGLAFWPWLLLAGVIGGGAGLLLWRRRSREAFAADHRVEAFVAPEPVPTPTLVPPAKAPFKPVVSKKFGAPPPAPPKAAPSKPVGVTSTKLRPWLEVTFKPLRCVVDQDRIALDFEVELLNSGATPARDVVVEACMLGASATQEQELAAFFAKPVPKESPIEVIAPLQRINLRSSLVAKRDSLHVVEVEGQKMLVPLMAFNAIYRAGSNEGRTSTSYLLGRSTKGEKLAPFPAGLAARAYSSLDTRLLPLGARN